MARTQPSQALVPAPEGIRCCHVILNGKTTVLELPTPRRGMPVDRKSELTGQSSPWIAIRRMKPAAPKIERAGAGMHRAGASAGPRQGLYHQD